MVTIPGVILMFALFVSSDGQCSGSSAVSAEFLTQLVPRSAALDPEAKRQVLRLRPVVEQDRQNQG